MAREPQKATKGKTAKSSAVENLSPSGRLSGTTSESSKKRTLNSDPTTNSLDKIKKRPRKEAKSEAKIKDSDSEVEYDLKSRLSNEDDDEDDEQGKDAKARLLASLKSRKSKLGSAASPSGAPSKSSALSPSSPSVPPRGSTPGSSERTGRSSDLGKSGIRSRPTLMSQEMTKPRFDILTSSPRSDKFLASAKLQTPSPRTPSDGMVKNNSSKESPTVVSSFGQTQKANFGGELSKPVEIKVLDQIHAANPATRDQALPELNSVIFTFNNRNIGGAKYLDLRFTAGVDRLEDSDAENTLLGLISYFVKQSNTFQEGTSGSAARRIFEIFPPELFLRTSSISRPAVALASGADNNTGFVQTARSVSADLAGGVNIGATVAAGGDGQDAEVAEEAEEVDEDGQGAESDNEAQQGPEMTENLG